MSRMDAERKIRGAALVVAAGLGPPEADPMVLGDFLEVVVAGGLILGRQVGGWLVPRPPGADAILGPREQLELRGVVHDFLDGDQAVLAFPDLGDARQQAAGVGMERV